MNEVGRAGQGYQLPVYPTLYPDVLTTGAEEKLDLVIAGGGLTGLTLLALLVQMGVRAVLLDEDNSVGVRGAASRGICYSQKSLEIFQKIGIYQRIVAKGITWQIGRTFSGDKEIYAFDLGKEPNSAFALQPPFINIQQFYIEGYLVERIAELTASAQDETKKSELRWGNKIVGLEKSPQGTHLRVATDRGEYALSTRYLVDGLGANSLIRKLLGLSFDAMKGRDRWCIADIRFPVDMPQERSTWIEADFNEGRAVWLHQMADAVWRIDYQLPADIELDETGLKTFLTERLRAQFGDRPYELVWHGPYSYRSAVVESMIVCAPETNGGADGGGDLPEKFSAAIFFAGDAAKVVSPFGARGGNSGIADADNLAWKLALVLQNKVPAAILNSYNSERLEAARENVLVTSRTKRFLRPESSLEYLTRQACIDLAKRFSFARNFVNTGRMSVANIYHQSPICAHGSSRALQNLPIRWVDGSQGSLADLLTYSSPELLLLFFGDLSAQDQRNLSEQIRGLPVNFVHVLSMDKNKKHAPIKFDETVLDEGDRLRQAVQLRVESPKKSVRWVVLRPDFYIAFSGSTLAGIKDAARRGLAMGEGD